MIIRDMACPTCGPKCRSASNRIRKVFRLWREGDFLTYKCARCGISGYKRNASDVITSVAIEEVDAPPKKDRSEVAAYLWDRSVEISGTPAEKYLHDRSCFIQSYNIRYLPPHKNHHWSMISKYGSSGKINAVHLTVPYTKKIILGKIGDDAIVISDNPEREELLIAEGIEDAASLALASGWSAWAAGSASQIPRVMARTKSFTTVFVAVDDDPAGRMAFERAKSIRPDVIPINFSKTVSRGYDANSCIKNHDADAVMASISWCRAQARHRSGAIGFDAMKSEMAWAERILENLA